MKILKYVRIFSLNFQDVLEERLSVFIWFLLALFSPLLMILFWKGAKIPSGGLNFTSISSYYLLLIVGGSFLMSHSEESTAILDIQEGRLSSYLLKPFSFFLYKFLAEIPYRFLQGAFGFAALLSFVFIFHIQLHVSVTSIVNFLLTIVLFAGALVLSHTYKMCLGFMAFWLTDAYGFFQLSEMLLFIFAGYIVPLSLYPSPFSLISYALPFAYMIYFPVAALEGLFTAQQLFLIVCAQLAWLGIFTIIYKIAWAKGVKLFTGVGQ